MKRIFVLSFLILFLEFSLIRYIPASIRLISYFTNLILIASFLGIGCGFLLSKFKYNLIFAFPFALAVLIGFTAIFKVEVNIVSSDVLFFATIFEKLPSLEPEFILPIIFLITALVFIPLAQALGKLFLIYKPLAAYSADILGSIAGIIIFSALSFFSIQPFWWFLAIALIFFTLELKQKIKATISLLVLITISCLVLATNGQNTFWSPYYKISIREVSTQEGLIDGWLIMVNNVAHQFISDFSKREAFYYVPYQFFKNPNYKDILIIGAGSGADVATAIGLDPSVENIDAVEIDPMIYKIGKDLNPDKPFDNPKVHIYIDDARSFLAKSNKKYDLIIYGLPDSLVLAGNTSNIRLESFLFTDEAFQLVKDHLTKEGLFTHYNYYREDWLIDKLAAMNKAVFKTSPYIISYGDAGKAAAILNGPKIKDLVTTNLPKNYFTKQISPLATDDWPFLYLKTKTIPFFYLKFIFILLIISAGAVMLISQVNKNFRFNWQLFAFGAGFMLLETKSLVNFAQLFGTTWIVNSLVIIAILFFVLLANLLNQKFRFKNNFFWYFFLFIALILQLIIPTSEFANLSLIFKYLAAAVFYFFPIFIANVLFSQKFKNVKDASLSFGSNILGGVLGGLLEYLALAIGYRILVLLIIFFYGMSLLKFKK